MNLDKIETKEEFWERINYIFKARVSRKTLALLKKLIRDRAKQVSQVELEMSLKTTSIDKLLSCLIPVPQDKEKPFQEEGDLFNFETFRKTFTEQEGAKSEVPKEEAPLASMDEAIKSMF